jgi:hypothetical protein
MSLKLPNALANVGLKYKKLKTPHASPSLFKLHTLAAFIGPRGSGKTNAAVLLAQRYLEDGSFTRVFIMSPTYDSNKVFELLDANPEDVFKDMQTAVADLDTIINAIAEDVEDYEKAKEYKRVYKKWKKFQKGKGPPLLVREMNLIENNNFRPGEDVPRPSPLLIIDDMSHSDLYSPSKRNQFVNLCLRHRHLHQVGLSIFMLVQNYRNGIPKCLRQNVQQFFLWPTHDMTQLQAMYEEFANLCTYEDFIAMYHKCTTGKHDFMTIDLNAKDDLLRFRKCFDEMVLPPSLADDKFVSELKTQNEEPSNPSLKRSKHA